MHATIKQYLKVDSSNIKCIGYSPKEKTLGVVFDTGMEYHYSDFMPEDWIAFCSADSIGKHFFSKIKTSFTFTKIGENCR